MTTTITLAPDTTDAPTARLTSRKFLLVLATLVTASVLLWFGHIEALIWRDVVVATVGAYIAANVTQKVLGSKAAAS